MGTSRINEIENQYKYYLKKRNLFLFFITVLGLIYLVTLIVLYNKIDLDLLITIYLPLTIVGLFLITRIRVKHQFNVMKYEYFRMLKEDLGPIKLTKPIFTQAFLDQFKHDNFKETAIDNDFLLYFQFYPKIKEIVGSGQVLVCVVIAKNEKANFYDERLDKAIMDLYKGYKEERKVKKQIVLQFKKYDKFDANSKQEIDQIINFKSVNNYLIHLSIGYFHDLKQVYYLRPNKRYSNKFHYYAIELIKKYTYQNGEAPNGQK